MIKQNEQAGRIALTDPMATTATNKTATNPISPAVLIFGAWLAGTLLFEISSLEDIGLQSATSDHWGIRATMQPESTAGEPSAASDLDIGVAELAESFVEERVAESLGDFRYENEPNS